MLAPKRQKYRKQFRGTWRKMAVKGNVMNFGSFGLKAMSKGWIKDREIEAARVTLARATRKSGKFWIKIYDFHGFPHFSAPRLRCEAIERWLNALILLMV